jgi:[NiFe] hydrogenase assembly HybE family chaperone
MSQVFESSYGGDGSRIADDTRLECGVCWWVYDPALGDEANQIPPGTPFRLLPDTWNCPNCSTDKHKFMVIGAASVSDEDSVQRLANAYRRAALRVKGMPIYNPTLAVEAVGFREHEGRQVGVMVTPWFMNLTVLPGPEDLKVWVVGGSMRLAFPSGVYDFVVNDLPEAGPIATCSLFSTMLDFTDHEAAQLAARTVAEAVFEPEQPPESAPAPQLSRRQLLGG